jgi:2,4-dienoyl-CoA reductase (NADPH2)
MTYPNLFQPLQLQHIDLRNRVVMGSMHTGLEEEETLDQLAAFYEERARHGVGLIITGGFAPDFWGALHWGAARMTSDKHVREHRKVTNAVHAHGAKICLQLLHAGRYAIHPFAIAPTPMQARINRFAPWSMSYAAVKRAIDHFVRAAKLAKRAGYDGVEIMGSEGYLINQFLAKATNHRKDDWGISYENRMRFAANIVSRIRHALGREFIIVYRMSVADLVRDGQSWGEITLLIQRLQEVGVSMLNTGIGWHESRVPTIAQVVPRAAFSDFTRRVKEIARVPVIASNRINDPGVAEAIIARGDADMISMARPFLADPAFVAKAQAGKPEEINTCVACNQACLDRLFERKHATCLVNPFAGREMTWKIKQALQPKRVVVIGGGPAGLAAALTAAQCGHQVTLYEKSVELGGQWQLASTIPGKTEFKETIRYFRHQLAKHGVQVNVNTTFSPGLVGDAQVLLNCAGVEPKVIPIENKDQRWIHYAEALRHPDRIGKKVVIIGGGGIAIDVALMVTKRHEAHTVEAYQREWGIDPNYHHRGALTDAQPITPSAHEVIILQRSQEKIGAQLGRTTAWIYREELKHRHVKIESGVEIKNYTEQGLSYLMQDEPKVILADTYIECVGQQSAPDEWQRFKDLGVEVHTLGGARSTPGLNAFRAIEEATLCALSLG